VLERDPDAVTPITAAVVVFAPVVFVIGVPIAMEIPIIRMVLDADITAVMIAMIGMPAVACVIADHVSGSGTN
jgi:hypothetical protein